LWVETTARVVEYFSPYWHDSPADGHADEDGADGARTDARSDDLDVVGADASAVPDAAELAALSVPELLVRYVPAPPAEADLVRVTSRYTQRAERVRELVEEEIAWPPPASWRPFEAATRAAETIERTMQGTDSRADVDDAANDVADKPAAANVQVEELRGAESTRPGWLRGALRRLLHLGLGPQPRRRGRQH
jgi:hypothetical protein